VLAEAAKWSRANTSVLKDTHWIGGDPSKLEVYGRASWARAKGILVLRNPSDTAQDFSLDIGKAFELPKNAATNVSADKCGLAVSCKDGIALLQQIPFFKGNVAETPIRVRGQLFVAFVVWVDRTKEGRWIGSVEHHNQF
jgi:hypothetical protein